MNAYGMQVGGNGMQQRALPLLFLLVSLAPSLCPACGETSGFALPLSAENRFLGCIFF